MKPRILLRFFAVFVLSTLLAGAAPPAIADSSRITVTAFTQVSFVANIETIGVMVSGSSLPKRAELMYRRTGETNWRTGHPLMRIDDGRLVGSLFELSPSTTYEIKVVDGGAEISGSVTTQADELMFTPSTVIYVDDDALPGGDGSFAAPFRTIQEGVNRAGPGTQVSVADGIYRENVTFPASGTAGNWIQVKAQGGGAILDGSEVLAQDVWTPYEGRSNVWFTKIGPGIGYLARSQKRFYNYADLSGLLNARGLNGVDIREGWFYEPGTSRLYVRVAGDPANYSWQVPRVNHAFDVDGRDWIWIEGFEMRFYGTTTNGCGVCALNASHVVIRRNRIHNLQLGVFINWTGGEDRGNDTRIEYNEIYDPPVNEWQWKAVKSSSMEGTAIIVRGHIGAIVRGNDIRQFFNGIYTGSSAALENPAVAFDADIYNNRIRLVSDDGLEPEGACVNHRFRNNTVDSMLVGISLAPVTHGPVWVMRSTFTNFSGTSIKWDLNSDGIALIYHNTSWTNAGGLNAMSMLRPSHNAVMRNNIFQGNGYAFEEAFAGSTGHDWDYDNWYTTRASPHFKWENVNYAAITDLCGGAKLECNGHENPPGLANPLGGDFTLLDTSPNIDRGIPIPGINDGFYGSAPDIGAFESAFGAPPPVTDTPPPQGDAPVVKSILRADPDPTASDVVRFKVSFSKNVNGVDTDDFTFATTGNISNVYIVEINGSGDVYSVVVHTGAGDGTLRLDILDNDSILDDANHPLGGMGVGNGNYVTGETYTISKTAPVVTSSLRADPSPTSAETVRFTVGFSKPITGVDAADFALTVSGVSDAFITDVGGANSLYMVTVKTGKGSGTIRLDVIDNDSIVDALGIPLGGVGAGNGNFSLGETYTVDRSLPTRVTSIFFSNGNNDGWVLESQENSNRGGSANAKAQTFRLGDDAKNNQYRAILDFSTASLPDNAVVTQVILMIQLQGVVGTNPFSTHHYIWVDIRQGAFGSIGPFAIGALQASDFQAPASVNSVGTIQNNPVGNWYWSMLDSKAFPYINLKGATQFRLGFLLDDNNNKKDDYLSFYSGDFSGMIDRPTLLVEYVVP